MRRSLSSHLRNWKNHPSRMPLILRGARQVGKTYLIEEFGREEFENVVTLNLELRPEFARCFSSLDPTEILNRVKLLSREAIVPGKTLLFIDEIQAEPKAIMALRYFKEMMPDLHVIGAGSLLEFALEEEQFSFPVGRVQFMYLYPLSFTEFLWAIGDEAACDMLQGCSLETPPDPVLHDLLVQRVREYFLVGGMPAVVDAYRARRDWPEVVMIQNSILDTYRSDFGKYATRTQHRNLSLFFERAPAIVAKHFKFSKVNKEVRASDLRVALNQLCWAGLINRVHATDGSGIPLRFTIRENKFKILFLDIGLLQRAHQIDPRDILEKDLMLISSGALAEQFVGQELLAYAPATEEKRLYYWEREARSSTAEVDFVVNLNSRVIPIEVKAGSTGRLKSLRQFMDEKDTPLGLRIHAGDMSAERGVISLPFYLLKYLSRFIEND